MKIPVTAGLTKEAIYQSLASGDALDEIPLDILLKKQARVVGRLEYAKRSHLPRVAVDHFKIYLAMIEDEIASRKL